MTAYPEQSHAYGIISLAVIVLIVIGLKTGCIEQREFKAKPEKSPEEVRSEQYKQAIASGAIMPCGCKKDEAFRDEH